MLRELCPREEVGTGNVADEVVLRGLHLAAFFQALLGDRRSYFPTSGCASCGSQVRTRAVNILLLCCNRDEFRWRLPYLVASRHYASQSQWCHSLGCGSSAKVNPPCMADSSMVRHHVATTPSRPTNPPIHAVRHYVATTPSRPMNLPIHLPCHLVWYLRIPPNLNSAWNFHPCWY